jgi:hypothetical protein
MDADSEVELSVDGSSMASIDGTFFEGVLEKKGKRRHFTLTANALLYKSGAKRRGKAQTIDLVAGIVGISETLVQLTDAAGVEWKLRADTTALARSWGEEIVLRTGCLLAVWHVLLQGYAKMHHGGSTAEFGSRQAVIEDEMDHRFFFQLSGLLLSYWPSATAASGEQPAAGTQSLDRARLADVTGGASGSAVVGLLVTSSDGSWLQLDCAEEWPVLGEWKAALLGCGVTEGGKQSVPARVPDVVLPLGMGNHAQISWLKNLQNRGGRTRDFTVVAGPWICGPGAPTAGKGVVAQRKAFENRCKAPLEEQMCVAVASKLAFGGGGEGQGTRQFLVVHNYGDGVRFQEEIQAWPLEQASHRYNASNLNQGTTQLTISKATHPLHPCAGYFKLFNSLNSSPKVAKAEMHHLDKAIASAMKNNNVLDSRTGGTIVYGCKYNISSFPGEESQIWSKLIYASPEHVARTFDGETEISLGAVWTAKEEPDAWWPIWKANQVKAYEDGQTLLVYSRRDWKNRVEVADLSVSADENFSWPGRSINFKLGVPIDQYGAAQNREIDWLRQMIKKGTFAHKRVEFRRVETVDEIRAVMSSGMTYRGGYDTKNKKHGFGTWTSPTGESYSGEYVHGVRCGQGCRKFVNADGVSTQKYNGEFRNGVYNGHGSMVMKSGTRYVGGWRKGKYDGEGTKTLVNGAWKQGKYELGECVATLSTGVDLAVRARHIATLSVGKFVTWTGDDSLGAGKIKTVEEDEQLVVEFSQDGDEDSSDTRMLPPEELRLKDLNERVHAAWIIQRTFRLRWADSLAAVAATARSRSVTANSAAVT